MKRLALLVPVVVAMAAALASCSDKTGGAAVPGTTTSTGTTGGSTRTTGSPTSTGTSSGGSTLAKVDPCALLTSEGVAQLKVKAGARHDVGSDRGCRWDLDGPTLDDTFTLDVVLYDKLGTKDVVGTQIKPVPTIGSHQAVTYVPPAGCAVSIAVGSSSRVDTQAVGGDQQKGCDLAMRLAKLVEPKLP